MNKEDLKKRILANTRRNRIIDKLFSGLVGGFSILMLVPLIAILAFITVKGISHVHLNLFVSDQRSGGILNAITGSLMIVAVATLIAVPVSVFTGIYLSGKKKSKTADIVRIIVDVLQGVPSIILGIVAYTWIVLPFKSFSAFAGSCALAIMMMPIIIKNTEESLSRIPATLWEAGFSMGAPNHVVLLQIILPAGLSGVTTGILIAISRVLGETAPLLFTAFGSRDMSLNMFKPMEALPPLIYKYATSPVNEWIDTAWAASFLLVAAVLFFNLITRLVTRKWKITF
ncbi:MAG: phosphate ABC transporter permease PstA [Spirochaetales bacterium]|nr:phosphate ABC transporter permease PstA [Spirochaetales bacterium]